MLDSQTKEILKYETFGPGSHHKRFRLNEDYIPLKQSTRRFEVRYDLVDAEIAICSRDVLNFFTDNFDCPDLYDDYINEVQSNEIIDDRIMAYEIDGGAYYARVLDPRTYGAITQDVLSRHLHPLVVDSKLLCPKSSYTFQSFNRYFDQDVQVALNTTVSNNSMLGKYTKVGTNSHIETSTIGEKCVIGKNVKMTNCYLWNNVEIQDGCELSNVIIAEGVVVKKGAKIESGSLISYGIIVREGVTVPAGTMASKYTFNSESLAFEKSKVTSSDLFENGVISYIPRECQLGKGENLGDPKPFDNEEDSDFEDDDDGDEENDREEFRREVRHTLDRCVKNKFSIQNAIMEVKNLKMTYNMDYPDCIEASYPVLLDLVG